MWYVAAAAMPALQNQEESKRQTQSAPLDDEQVEQLRQRCEAIFANEATAFERELKRKNLADYKWIMQVKRSGTTSDKVAAITLQVQVSEWRGKGCMGGIDACACKRALSTVIHPCVPTACPACAPCAMHS